MDRTYVSEPIQHSCLEGTHNFLAARSTAPQECFFDVRLVDDETRRQSRCSVDSSPDERFRSMRQPRSDDARWRSEDRVQRHKIPSHSLER